MSLRRVTAAIAMAGLGSVAVLACDEEDVVTLELAVGDGFACTDEEGASLLRRAAEVDEVCFVLDVVTFEGTPSCRVSELREACCDGKCDVLPSRRVVALPTAEVRAACGDTTTDIDLDCVGAKVREAVSGLGWDDAPEGYVALRLISQAEPCDVVRARAIDAVFPRPSLVGCAFSCPAELATLEGTVTLDLDVVDGSCEGVVAACANLGALGCEP